MSHSTNAIPTAVKMANIVPKNRYITKKAKITDAIPNRFLRTFFIFT